MALAGRGAGRRKLVKAAFERGPHREPVSRAPWGSARAGCEKFRWSRWAMH